MTTAIDPAGAASSHAPAHGRYRRLLLPFDGEPPSRRALAEAIALARECGATVDLLAMFEPARHVSGFEPPRYAVDELLPRARKRLADALEAACQAVRAAGVPVSSQLVDGQAIDLPQRVTDRVEATGADLVVMGTHGRRGVTRWLLGSVAETILRRAPVPVLLVRTPDE